MFLGKTGCAVLACGLLLPWAVGGFTATLAASTEPPQAEQALRKRVEEFWSFWQAANWTRAEDYLTEESKQAFLAEQKGALPRVEVDTLELAEDQQSAKATVRIYIVSPFSPQPFPFRKTTEWRQVKGVWFCDWLSSNPAATKGLSDIRKEGMSPPAPEQLKFKGHKYGLGLVWPNQIKAARFPFENVTDHEVELTSVDTGCKCLQIKTQKKSYKPGESGELVVEFNPAGYKENYVQTVLVKTDPGNITTYLMVGAYVVPPPPPLGYTRAPKRPKPPGSAKGGSF
jgi:hypothetical protein